MFGIGETELVIIVVFAFMLFGPDKLPGMGRTLGRVLRQFREASDGFTEVVQTNIMDPASEELEKSPKQRRREELERAEAAADAEDGAVREQDDAGDKPEPRRETFAERRARLAAERAAKEQAAAVVASDAQEASAEESSPKSAPEAEDAPAASTNDVPAAAMDLYAMAGMQHSSRYRAAEHADEASETIANAEDANGTATTDGEEDGDAEA